MNIFKKHPIMVPYDFTSVSDTAIRHAARFSQITGSSVSIYNTIDASTENYLKQHNQIDQFIHSKLDLICKDIIAKYEIDANYQIKRGEILTIPKIADEIKASFLFMGIDQPHTTSSDVMKVLCTSPAPVYIVQGDYEFLDPKCIVFPVDEFEETRQKVQCAITCSRLFNATINLFSMKPGNKDQLFKQNVIVSQIERLLHKEQVPYTTEYAKEKPSYFADELLEYAQMFDATLLVLMKTPRVFSSSKISTEEKKVLLNSLSIPVIIVNPKDVGRYY